MNYNDKGNSRMNPLSSKSNASNLQTQQRQYYAMTSQEYKQNNHIQLEQQTQQPYTGTSKIKMMQESRINSAAVGENRQQAFDYQYQYNNIFDTKKLNEDLYQNQNQNSINPSSHNTTSYQNCDIQQLQQNKNKIQIIQQKQESRLLQQGHFDNLTHQNSQDSQSSKNESPQSTTELIMKVKQENESLKQELEQQKQSQAQRDKEYKNKFQEIESFMKIMSQKYKRPQPDNEQQSKLENLERQVKAIERNQRIQPNQEQEKKLENLERQVKAIENNQRVQPYYEQKKSELKQYLELQLSNIVESQQKLKQQFKQLFTKCEQEINHITIILNNHKEEFNIIKTKVLNIDQNQSKFQKIDWLQVEENSLFNSNFEEENCCHCQQKIIEKYKTLQCGHNYHESCIIEVIQQQLNNSCLPQCLQCKQQISNREIYGLDNSLSCREKIINIQMKIIKDQMTYSECKNCSFFWISKYSAYQSQCEQCEQ